MLAKIKESADFISKKVNFDPQIGIILGTGLGGLVNEIDIKFKLPYEQIPNFPVSTVAGHHGQLIFGYIGGKKVVALQGRFHFYEGYSLQEVVHPVRVMKLLGISHLFVSNASGGVNSDFSVGDMMVITDHINLFPGNPLIGKNIDELGPRFLDMSDAYNKELIDKAFELSAKHNILLRKGVYAGLSGPSYETPAEYNYVRIVGADAVGMSTVPEVIIARHMGIVCFAISIITDLGIKGKIESISHTEVQKQAANTEPKMSLIFRELIKNLEL